MSDDEGYKQAYERERKIRRQAEQLLEDKSRELYLQNSRLETSYSALKRQQAAMLTQEKLATLGTLSAGIAHEINTPLGFMKSNMESLRQHLENYSRLLSIINNHCKTLNEKDRLEVQKEIAQLDLHYAEEDYPDLLSETVAGIKRVHDIVLHLKNFSQTGEISNGMVNIVESVEDTVTLMGNDLRSNLKLKLELEPADPVPGNPSEINQA
ncbi:MAG: sensor histidine kinase, partial [Pontibacterium sp.]